MRNSAESRCAPPRLVALHMDPRCFPTAPLLLTTPTDPHSPSQIVACLAVRAVPPSLVMGGMGPMFGTVRMTWGHVWDRRPRSCVSCELLPHSPWLPHCSSAPTNPHSLSQIVACLGGVRNSAKFGNWRRGARFGDRPKDMVPICGTATQSHAFLASSSPAAHQLALSAVL